MAQPPYRAVVLDFDRTLLHTDKTISPFTLRVLDAWHKAGARLLAATARPERAVGEYRALIPFDGIVTLNGARILGPGGVIENPIAAADADEVLAALDAAPGAWVTVEAADGIYSNRSHPLWRPLVLPDLRLLPGNTAIYKILASHPSLPAAETLPALPPDCYSTVADGTLLQVMDRRATKWLGVQALLRAFMIPAAETVYFGDDNDDLECIENCGLGVAVRNALPRVRAAADAVAGDNDGDGPALYLASLYCE